MFINNFLYLNKNKFNHRSQLFFLFIKDKKEKCKICNYEIRRKLINIMSHKRDIILEKTKKFIQNFIQNLFQNFSNKNCTNLFFLQGRIPYLILNNNFNSKKLFCEIAQLNKPYLGCSIRSNEEGTQGMKVLMIKSDSPAEKAGLRVRDIIVEINGKKVRDINEYNAAVGLEPGRKKVKIVRKEADQEKELEFYVDFILTE
jgi:predicted metalloprotease with PDZ domain